MDLRTKNRISGMRIAFFSIMGFIIFYIIPFIVSIRKIRIREISNLMKSDAFYLALNNTGKFLLIGVPLLFLLSLAVAFSMEHLFRYKVPGRGIIMGLHILPMVIPSILIAFIIQMFFEQYGIVNGWLVSLGFTPIKWLTSSKAFVILLLIFLWKNYGYCMVIALGGLQGISKDTIEAARLDGANEWDLITKIDLPQIKSHLIFMLMIEIVGVFKVFRESYMLFGNYPEQSIYMIQNFMNNCLYSLNYNRIAVASIMIIVVMVICIVAVLLVIRHKKRATNRFDLYRKIWGREDNGWKEKF